MTITSPKDEHFASAVRGYRLAREYGPREEQYDQVEECGHEWTCDGLGNSRCIHCDVIDPN